MASGGTCSSLFTAGVTNATAVTAALNNTGALSPTGVSAYGTANATAGVIGIAAGASSTIDITMPAYNGLSSATVNVNVDASKM
jgi:hypothetical protein